MTAQQTGTLAEFLLARIEAAEAKAYALGLLRDQGDSLYDRDTHAMKAAAVIDPDALRAECEAKRRIVELHRPSAEGYTDSDGNSHEACLLCQWDVDCESPRYDHQYPDHVREHAKWWPCDTLRALAQPYADHPDFREEWRA